LPAKRNAKGSGSKMDSLNRDLIKLLILVSFVPIVLVGFINFRSIWNIAVFEKVELAVLFLAMVIASINYAKTTFLVSSVLRTMGAATKLDTDIRRTTSSVILHYIMVIIAFTLGIGFIMIDASAFLVLGLIFCIYIIFVQSNLSILDMVADEAVTKAYQQGTFGQQHKDYISLSFTNLVFLRSENLPTCLVYLLLLAICFGAKLLSGLYTRETVQIFAAGAAVVHLVISTVRFNQIIRDTSDQPLSRKDVLDLMIETLGPHDVAKVCGIQSVCASTVQGSSFRKGSLVLMAILLAGVAISVCGVLISPQLT
jgi:hypothetical protein